MRSKPGNAYIYYSGQVPCLNFVCDDRENFGSAVLVRAIYPFCNLEAMLRRRKTKPSQKYLEDHKRASKNLCNGPGVLCEALGINFVHYEQSKKELSLFDSPFQIRAAIEKQKLLNGIRIGLHKQYERWKKSQPNRAPADEITAAAKQKLRWGAAEYREYLRHRSFDQEWKEI
jgi:3-methyladenine DNA glycosylase Mpg